MITYNENENTIVDCLIFIESFEIFEDGERKLILTTDKQFNQIYNSVYELFLSSRLMPAFGVSLHDETLNEITKGDWLQINFKKEMNKNGLPFNSLLFKIEEVNGFNLIRLYENKYDGRCLYLDLNEIVNLKHLLKK